MKKRKNKKPPPPPKPPSVRPPRPPRPPPPKPKKRSIGTQTPKEEPVAVAVSDRLTLENHPEKSLAEMVNKIRSDQLLVACRLGINTTTLPVPNTMPVKDLVRYGVFCRHIKNHLMKNCQS